MNYLQWLFKGHALTELGRHAEAVDAYRQATLAIPGAQSARISHMNALLHSGNAEAAQGIAGSIDTSRVTDPWWLYWYGAYRWLPRAMQALREFDR
jgi:hypothetical protein